MGTNGLEGDSQKRSGAASLSLLFRGVVSISAALILGYTVSNDRICCPSRSLAVIIILALLLVHVLISPTPPGTFWGCFWGGRNSETRPPLTVSLGSRWRLCVKRYHLSLSSTLVELGFGFLRFCGGIA